MSTNFSCDEFYTDRPEKRHNRGGPAGRRMEMGRVGQLASCGLARIEAVKCVITNDGNSHEDIIEKLNARNYRNVVDSKCNCWYEDG